MTVSVAIVAYNEEKYLPALWESLVAQDYPHEKIEVLLIDSVSTDSTRAMMKGFAAENHGFLQVRVLENPGKIIPCGCNVALKHYTGDAIVRPDAHVALAPDFLSKNVALLESGEDVAGGVVESVLATDTPFQRTLLLAENSAFCGGIASFRRLTEKDYVSTLAFGLYRRRVFDTVGLYNEVLACNEDNDMSYRIRKAGFRLCCDPSIQTRRVTRSSFRGLLRQKYRNGYWIGKTMGIQPKCFSLFHFVPFFFVLGIVLTSVLSALGFPWLGIAMWGAYWLLAFAFAGLEISRTSFAWSHLLLPFVYFLLHLVYGTGTLLGLAVMPFWVGKIKKNTKSKGGL